MSGVVKLEYQGNAQGRVADSRIVKSSGYRELDKAAIAALSRCTLPVPADGAGSPPAATIEYKFGAQTGVASASKPVLIAGSCAPSEHDPALAAEAVRYIATCRFNPATQNGVAVAGSSAGFIRMKAAQ
jgi:TonB family protein